VLTDNLPYNMKKLFLLVAAVLMTVAGVQAQIPAEVNEVMSKCRKAMANPNGLEYTMDMKSTMGPITLTNSRFVIGGKGDMTRMAMTMKVVGIEVTLETGYDGKETWVTECDGENDTIRITKGRKAKSENKGLDLDLAKGFQKAKMKLKDGYYEIDFSDPIDKNSEIKKLTLMVSAKNYYIREMRTSTKGAKVTMTVSKIKVGLHDDYFKVDLGKYPNAVIIRE
jgi:outer membrane lipoprotein-sorting protein